MKGINVHPFKVLHVNDNSTPLIKILKNISLTTSLEKRIRTVGGTDVRVEDIKKLKNGCYLMDFVRLRFEHGPGKASKGSKIEGFRFSKGQGFGEETAALYDPKSNHIIVQYNQHGVRSGRIADYFSQFDDNPDNLYVLETRFDPDVEQKLKRKKIIRHISFKVSANKIDEADFNAGVSLNGILESAKKSANAETLTIALHAEKGVSHRSLNKNFVADSLDWLYKRIGIESDSVQQLTVAGKDDIDTAQETINLLGHRLVQKFKDLKVGDDLRYPRNQRYYALERALNGWKSILKK